MGMWDDVGNFLCDFAVMDREDLALCLGTFIWDAESDRGWCVGGSVPAQMQSSGCVLLLKTPFWWKADLHFCLTLL